MKSEYKKVKTAGDIVVASVMLVILSPILLIITALIRLESPGPTFFLQRRIGLNKTEFNIIKFRTMKSDSPSDVPTHQLDEPEKHITRVGQFLRKSSLDELPQLINIIKREMSFVGPRPALWNQFDLITERDKYNANSVLPGITGLAQVSGRDELPIDVKAKIDGDYVRNISLSHDLVILLKTFSTVISRKGIKEGK